MKSESGFSLAIASLPLWIKMDLSLWIKIDWLFPHTGRRLGKRDRSPTPLENSCRIFNGCRAENVRPGDPFKNLTNHSDELEHFADDVWALQRLLWTSWLCRRSIRHYFWLSFHQSFFFLVHKSSPVWENRGKVTDPVRLHKQGRYLQSGVRTKGVVLLVRLVEKKVPKATTAKKRLKDLAGRVTSSPFLSVWMYVIREMEDAVTDCTAGHSHQFFKFMTLKKTIQDAIRATRPPCTLGTKPGRSTQAALR